MTRRTRFTLAVAALPLLFTAACSNADDDGDPDTFAADGEVPVETVESNFEAQLEELGYTEYADVACEPLEDKVDATSTCAVTLDGVEYEVPVTVSASDDTTTTMEFDPSVFGA